MDMQKLEKIKASFTDEQNNLKAEWMLGRRMYDQAAAIIKAKETGIEVRLLLREASTAYWNRRRLALERTLAEVGMNEDLVAWRKEYDAKS